MHPLQRLAVILVTIILSSSAKAMDQATFLADPITALIELGSAYQDSPTRTIKFVENMLGLSCNAKTAEEARCTPVEKRSRDTVASLWFAMGKAERVELRYVDGHCLRLADFRKMLPPGSEPGPLPIPGLPVPGHAPAPMRVPYVEPPYVHQSAGKAYVIATRTTLGLNRVGSARQDDCVESILVTHWPR